MNWMRFLQTFFEEEKDSISRILDAEGCREIWIQGALFLRAEGVLQTNATAKKYDLYSQKPPMIGEIKVCGGEYHGKMKDLIEADKTKLCKGPPEAEKFMILVIDTRENTTLGEWLKKWHPSHEYSEVAGKHVRIRIWKL